MEAGDIQSALRSRYSGAGIRYKISNVFLFNHDWESDFLIVRTNGYCSEMEIKTTRSDFFADFKKVDKHLVLQHGDKAKTTGYNLNNFRPNKFYYAVPEGLIKESEVPSYAGLIYTESMAAWTVKEAPFLHKKAFDLHSRLCLRIYSQLQNEKFKNWQLEQEIVKLKNINASY